MEDQELKDNIHELFHSFLDLCDEYKEKLPCHEFSYAMIRFLTKLVMDAAQDEKKGFELIKVAVDSGIEWHRMEEKE